MDIQTAFNEMARAVYELTAALEGLSAVLLTEIAQQPGNSFDKLADRIDQFADSAGKDQAAITGGDPSPNPILANMATVLRAHTRGDG
jgi:hypothetical protein